MLPQSKRIHTDADFKRLRLKGRKWQSASFIALSLPTRAPYARLGVIVSNKIGKAVVRKRAARILRAAYTQVEAQFPLVDVVLIARPYIKDKTSREVADEIQRMVRKGRDDVGSGSIN